MKLENVRELVKLMDKSGLTELNWTEGDSKLILKKELSSGMMVPYAAPSIPIATAVSAPVVAAVASPEVAKDKAAPAANAQNYHEVTSPMVGTLYLSPSPDEPNYVKVGDMVQKGQVICIIEAMKLMNEIESDVTGQVMEILKTNEAPVEFGTPLFRIK